MIKKASRIENITIVVKSGDPPIQIIAKDTARLRTRIRVNLPKTPA